MKRCPPLTAPDLHLALYPLLLGTDMLYLSYLHYLSTCVQPCICGTLVLPAQTFLSLSLNSCPVHAAAPSEHAHCRKHTT